MVGVYLVVEICCCTCTQLMWHLCILGITSYVNGKQIDGVKLMDNASPSNKKWSGRWKIQYDSTPKTLAKWVTVTTTRIKIRVLLNGKDSFSVLNDK
jgi:hypothetical protein